MARPLVQWEYRTEAAFRSNLAKGCTNPPAGGFGPLRRGSEGFRKKGSNLGLFC